VEFGSKSLIFIPFRSIWWNTKGTLLPAGMQIRSLRVCILWHQTEMASLGVAQLSPARGETRGMELSDFFRLFTVFILEKVQPAFGVVQ
jgi:hypothetical protein